MTNQINPTNNPANPFGSNQYSNDPRQRMCWELYINPKSETFSNATQSALKAGYTLETSKHITLQDWFIQKLRRLNMLGKAEKVLDSTLTFNPVDPTTQKVDSSLLRVQTDVAKHITLTLGKEDGYTTRTETTGKDGKDLNPPPTAEDERIAQLINEQLSKGNGGTNISPEGQDTKPMGAEVRD